MADGQVKVSIEAAVHNTIAEVVQSIFNQYGVRVDSIGVQWIDKSTCNDEKHMVKSVSMVTQKGRFNWSDFS